MNKHIFIVGFMCAGKTTMAKKLALKYNLPHLDSDSEIEKSEGQSISEIFEKNGENYFRRKEKNWLDNLSSNPCVISCGGGLPCFNDNILALKKMGIVIYLDTPMKIILQRIFDDFSRPLVMQKSPAEITLLKMNREIYYLMADIHLKNVEEMDKIYSLIKKYLL